MMEDHCQGLSHRTLTQTRMVNLSKVARVTGGSVNQLHTDFSPPVHLPLHLRLTDSIHKKAAQLRGHSCRLSSGHHPVKD
jgi:hypothetical protein